MDTQAKQIPTITVKKADGSVVKMTLPEFKAYKKTSQGQEKEVNGIVLEPREVAKVNVEPHNLPMVENSQAVANSTPTIVGEVIKDLKKGDFSSPLEEANLAPPPVQPKVNTLAPPALPVVNKKTEAQKIFASLIAKDRANFIPAISKLDTGKVAMHDVVTIQKSMGPVDEMQAFTLTDWKRLGNNPQASADALTQKFQLLKNESYLLFLQGKAAWFKSPLYLQYLGVLERSLNQNQPLDKTVGAPQKGELGLPDARELARVSQSLNA